MTTARLSRTIPLARRGLRSRLSVWLDRLSRWHRDQQTRLHLADLPPHMLRDIGLSETDRDHETKKWFWQG
jgi:uncharacterized protein YjiS (DUF1127 family)